MIQNYINGAWVDSRASQSTPIVNPATGETLEHCPIGSTQDVDDAVAQAKEAFKSWRQVPAIERVQYLFRFKTLIEEQVDELARQVTLENGKTLPEAKASVRRAIQMIDTATGMPSFLLGDCAEDIARGIDCVAMKRPLGVFSVIAPFNFPAMVPFWFWPFGVAAGNTFVIKPSEKVPLTQQMMFRLVEKAGFPKGVVNLVNGGKDVANALCLHPDIAGISFVGSTPVAQHVYRTACEKGKRVQSLGGAKNFMVVLPDATIERASSTALESIIGCAGERCLAGSVVLCVGQKTYDDVCEKMVRKASDISVGDGLDPNSQMGPLISEQSKSRVVGLIGSAEEQGAKVLLDGRKDVDHLPGYFLKPSVVAGVTPDMRIAQEEVFGPVVCLAKIDSFDQAIQWINSSPFANTTTLFTNSGAAARKFCYEVDPSMIGINIGVPAPMAFFSFGGAKHSFFGDIKAHGARCVDFYTDTKVTIQRWESDASIW